MKRILLFSLALLATSISAESPAPRKVMVLFDAHARHIDLVRQTRRQIESAGGRVRGVIGLSAILADLPPSVDAQLSALEGVRVYDGRVSERLSTDVETATALAAWGRLLASEPLMQKFDAAPQLHALMNDLRETTDLPHNEIERANAEADYQRHWQQVQSELPPQLRHSNGAGCAKNGAGYYDTSLYFAGDVAVGVFYTGGPKGGWTPNGGPGTESIAAAFADVIAALDYYITMQPNARLAFTYVSEVSSGGYPKLLPLNDRAYVNDLRNTYCTDWAFDIHMSNGGMWPQTTMHGPTIWMERTFGWFHDVLRHEVAHVFGAGDAYPPANPGTRYGYLKAMHTNACGPSGGYFAGTGECLDDLMAGWGPKYGYNSRVSPSTAGQLGWFASDGDGLLDVLKTMPLVRDTTVNHAINAGSTVTYHGTAAERAVLNEETYGSVSINRITAVKYRIGPTPWQDALPTDGVFDSASEDFHFTTPPLRSGTYTVEIRAVNTIGAMTPVPYSEQLVIANSSVTNTRPFARIFVTPARAVVGTKWTASAGGSTDLDAGALSYSWNWNGAWSAFSPSSSASYTYATPGTHTVQLRVRDQGGLEHLVTQNVEVAATDTPPAIQFKVTPENRHLTASDSFTMLLSVVGSRDAETAFGKMTVRWDFDGDGTWDTPFALQKVRVVSQKNPNHPKSLRQRVRAEIQDAAGNTALAERIVWVVPYNHAPKITGATFTPLGPDYTMTVTATDPDFSTTWDGLLEYRFDFDGDGLWDTKYQGPTVTLNGAYRYTVRVEVRDRFHARDSRSWSLGCIPYPPYYCW